jgi:hypothetical protein
MEYFYTFTAPTPTKNFKKPYISDIIVPFYFINTNLCTIDIYNFKVFENKEAIKKFKNIKKENDILESKKEKQIPAESKSTSAVDEEIRDVSKMVLIDERQVYYDETDDT